MTAKHKPATALPTDEADRIYHASGLPTYAELVERNERLVEALLSMIEAHSDITEGNLHSGAPARVAVKRDARALLRELGEAE